MQLIAHRGSSTRFPENTMPAFNAAIASGVDGFETDLRLCADGVVIGHDADTSRFGGSKTPILQRTLASCADIDVGSWKHERFAGVGMPSLDQVLETFRGRGELWLELKPARDPKRARQLVDLTVKAISRHGTAAQCLLLCFDSELLSYARTRSPRLRRVWNVNVPPTDLRVAKRLGINTIDCNLAHVTAEHTARLHAAGFRVAAYSTDTVPGMNQAYAYNLDALMTNDPRHLLNSWQRQEQLRTRRPSKARHPYGHA